MSRPLDGLQIVECASFVAGPTAGMTLAQLGASVIRVDPIGGGADHRRWPVVGDGEGPADAESYYWTSLNKGKRSVALDLRSDRGRELLLAIVTASGQDRGILVDNVVGRRWMAHDVLAARRPDLVHVRVQGHPDGRPAVDYTVNAEVGVPQITGSVEGGTPVNHVLPAWDLVTGQAVATAVLAGVHHRTRTGDGAYVQIALADVALAGVANLGWLSEAADRAGDRPRHGNHVYGSFGVDFACADGERVMVVALTEGQWDALRGVTGTGDVFGALEKALEIDLSREAERYRLRDTIAAILTPWFAARDSATVADELDGARVLWGRYRGMAGVVAAHREGGHPVLAELPLDDGVTSVTGRSPIRWSTSGGGHAGDGHGPVGRAPVLGRDTHAVLADLLGLDTHEIGRLADDGVVPA
ncbi:MULTISPECIES: CoA transferase [unclassified Pseudonocardia]|uniref:CoA transferase n=1 Tax=unclassified Pseudonocardia TaxID=2619320 RepID=UPI0001FFDDFC|nr:CoA transferase [Pseudonocardia sp. Ae707_Ps1]OLM16768.1 Mesaconyl-CoA C1-C4 CoA transferase [Pseudonocardia sp. Ae707_Ps1]